MTITDLTTTTVDPTLPGLLARVVEVYRLDRPAIAELQAHLRAPEAEIRIAALRVLVRATRDDGPSGGAGDAFSWALADDDPEARRIAIDALRDLPELSLGDDGVRALRLAAASGPDSDVRATATELLDTLVRGAAELYAQGLQDDEPHLRAQAVHGLVALHAVTEVAEAADDPDRDVRAAVAEGLARLAVPAGLPVLDHLLADHDPVVRMAALDAAAELNVPEPLAERVAAATSHSGWQVRRRAAFALGAAAPETAIPVLVRALQDRIVDVRRAAIQSLEQWAADHPEVLEALTEALADQDPGVRTQARWALA